MEAGSGVRVEVNGANHPDAAGARNDLAEWKDERERRTNKTKKHKKCRNCPIRKWIM